MLDLTADDVNYSISGVLVKVRQTDAEGKGLLHARSYLRRSKSHLTGHQAPPRDF